MSPTLSFFVRRLPMFLLLVAAIVFAIVRWSRHPRVSLLTIIALVFFIVEFTIYATVLAWLPRLHDSLQMSYDSLEYVYIGLAVLDDFAFAGVNALLVAAAFTGRAR
jgi:hypothetical protein